MEILNLVVVVAAGLMVGAEVAIAAFVHPTLNRQPDAVHLPAASALARLLGKVMPLWYALVLLLALAETLLQWRQSDRWPIWTATSAILWALAIVYSVTALVPINNRIASWGKDIPPTDWRSLRDKWDQLHRRRVVLLTIAFAFLIAGVLMK
jgi:hypothetical protein